MPYKGKVVKTQNRKAIVFIGAKDFVNPIELSTSEKADTLSDYFDLYYIWLSWDWKFRIYKYKGTFFLLPHIPIKGAGMALLQLLSPIYIIYLVLFKKVRIVCAMSPYEAFPAAIAKLILHIVGKKIKLLVESHGDFEKSLFLIRNIHCKGIIKKILSFMFRVGIKNSDCGRAVSIATYEQLKKWNSSLDVHIYPAWMNIDIFYSACLKCTNKSDTIIFVGDITFLKGVDVLVKAFAKIHEVKPNFKLKIIGRMVNKAYFNEVKNIISENNLDEYVIFGGFLSPENLAVHMAEARVLVLPSRSEGFGRVLVESLAAGTPIVCTRVGGMPDIAQDKKYSEVVAVEDVESLQKGISRFLREYDEREMKQVAMARAKVLFSKEDFLYTMLAMLK